MLPHRTPPPLSAFEKSLQGWERKARSLPVPGGPFRDPAQRAWLEGSPHRGAGLSAQRPSCYALCACGQVAWLRAASLGHPRALQKAEMPPGALPGSAATGQPWPGLCPATGYGRALLQPEGPRRQPAHDRHVPREHLCAQVQILPLPGHPAPEDNRGGERNC